MEYELIVRIILVVFVSVVSFFMLKGTKKQAMSNEDRRTELHDTAKAVKKILLNNRWGSVDEKVDILIDDSVQIDFNLGIRE